MKRLARSLTLCVMLMVQFVPSAWAQQGGTFIPIADITVQSTATLIRAANSGRIVLVCTNTDGAVAIRLGDSTATPTRGVRLNPGATTAISATSAVYGAAESGTPVIACSEEIR